MNITMYDAIYDFFKSHYVVKLSSVKYINGKPWFIFRTTGI